MNSQMLSELLKILDQEAEIYSSLLELSKNKTRIIVEGKVAELENIVKVEQSLVLQLGRLDARREDVVEKLAGELGTEPSKLNMTALLEKVGDNQAEELRKYQKHMTDIIKELKNANELNFKLIKNALDFIDFSINMLTGNNNAGNNYESTGMTRISQRRNLLDIKL